MSQRWPTVAAAGVAACLALAWLAYDRTTSNDAATAPGAATSEVARRSQSSSRGARAPSSARRAAGEVSDELEDEDESGAAPSPDDPGDAVWLPGPGKRGSLLDTSDPCEPLVLPHVAAELERVSTAGVTIAWPPEVKVSEPTALAYVISGLLQEAALATGTDARERLTVFLHDSRDELHLATGTPEWASGVYDGAVHLVAAPRTDFGVRMATLRHEVMHAQLHAGVGCMPAWFNEGVAQHFAGPAPVDSWMALLKSREGFDFDALSTPTIIDAPKDGAAKLYGESLAMVLFELDRAGDGGLQAIVQGLHAIDASDPLRRARMLWKTRNPSASAADVRASLGKRIFGVSSEREIKALLADQVCCTGSRRIGELSCRAREARDVGAAADVLCQQY